MPVIVDFINNHPIEMSRMVQSVNIGMEYLMQTLVVQYLGINFTPPKGFYTIH